MSSGNLPTPVVVGCLWINCIITGLAGIALTVLLVRIVKKRRTRMIGTIVLVSSMLVNQFAYCYQTLGFITALGINFGHYFAVGIANST